MMRLLKTSVFLISLLTCFTDFVEAQSPMINSFSPTTGRDSSIIEIKGHFFTDVYDISFGGVAARNFTVANDITILAMAGMGASGDVRVSNFSGTDAKGGYLFTGCAIYSFTPQGGRFADTVTIRGENFTNVSGVYLDTFSMASYTVLNDSVIVAILGNGRSGAISVVTDHGRGRKTGFGYATPFIYPVCPPSVTMELITEVKGQAYQWQLLTNGIFVDMQDDQYFSNTNSDTLRLTSVPSSFTGSTFRCRVDGWRSGYHFNISFDNLFYGNGNWDDVTKWECGVLPDEHTNVTIYGSAIINVNTSVRSIYVGPNWSLTVAPGAVLTLTH